MTTEPIPDWGSVRARYEQGAEKVQDIAASIGVKPMALSLKAKALGWILRGAAGRSVKSGINPRHVEALEGSAATARRQSRARNQ